MRTRLIKQRLPKEIIKVENKKETILRMVKYNKEIEFEIRKLL